MEVRKRDFTQEWNDKMKALKSTSDLFAGTTWLKSLQQIAEEIYKHLPNLRMTDLHIKYFVELQLLRAGEVTQIDMFNFSIYVNMIPKLSAKDLGLSIEDYIIVQNDAFLIIKHFNDLVQPLKVAHEAEAKKYEVKMNPPGSMPKK